MEQKTQFIFEIEPTEPDLDPQHLQFSTDTSSNTEEKTLKVRLDKWLWAARFFKTRALARSAIENGKVFYDGIKTIPSKEITVGATLLINQGKSKKIIIIRQLSTRRRSTDEANALFEELAAHNYSNETLHMALEPKEPQDLDKKPRKMARFLRRALTLGESDPTRD